MKVAQDGPIEQLTAAVERKTGISVNNVSITKHMHDMLKNTLYRWSKSKRMRGRSKHSLKQLCRKCFKVD